MARQVTAAIVSSPAEQERLLTLAPLTSEQVHVIDPTQPHLGQTLTALYTRLECSNTLDCLEPPFVYVQRSQEVMLFPVIEACKLVALQTPFPFMPHT